MAKVVGVDCDIWQDQYDITGYSNKVSVNFKRDLTDVTVFGSTGHNWWPILHGDEITIESLFDDVASGSWDAVRGKLTATSSGVITIIPAGSAYGAVAPFGRYWQESAPITIETAGIIKVSQSLKMYDRMAGGAHGLQEGIVLYPKTTLTGDAYGTAQNNGAGSTGGYTAALHVFSVSASDTLDVAIQQSTTGAWGGEETTLASFTQATAAGAEYISGTGTVNQYLRTYMNVTGSDVSIVAAVVFNRL